ncbi:MAG: hypothetical protein WKF74_01905 [Pyrinomonadaceae bacterium]
MKVFYSWQSDLPNPTNRGFIQKALENAAKSIRDDDSIEVEPRIDHDTSGVPGAPDIISTILQKIDEADAFVADISIINLGERRPTSNPNVLIELGYALKAKGAEKIILVINTAFGPPESLPFDLRMRRAITYNMPEQYDDKATERRRLEGVLEDAIRIISMDLNKPIPGELIEPEYLETVIDPILEIEQKAHFATERNNFLHSESGVALARQEVEKLRSTLQEKATKASERSTLVRVSFNQNGNNDWVLFCSGISLAATWSPTNFTNLLEGAELYLGVWQGRVGVNLIRAQQPKLVRHTRYFPDMHIKRGIGWVDSQSKRDFYSSDDLS